MNNRLFSYIKQAFSQIRRNIAMTLASMFSITAIMLILGLFFIIMVNVNSIVENVKSDFDTVQVYLLDETDEVRTQEIMNEFKNMPDVEEVSYLTKDEAMESFRNNWGDSAYLLDNIKENPLPNTVVVTVPNVESADSLVAQAKSMPGVEDLNYYKDTVEKLMQVTNFIQIGALIVIIFLVFISIIVVSNTIKLTVLAREKEINIMKYVGATNWYIRGPFLVEGMIIGALSAIVSVGIVAAFYHWLIGIIGTELVLIFSTSLLPEQHLASNLVIIFLALGISIGACGSIVSMRRFLDT
jgi:cell division transport system permease protein